MGLSPNFFFTLWVQNDVVLALLILKGTGQNDAILALFSFPTPFSGIFQLDTTPNRALASVVQWRSEEEEEEEEEK